MKILLIHVFSPRFRHLGVQINIISSLSLMNGQLFPSLVCERSHFSDGLIPVTVPTPGLLSVHQVGRGHHFDQRHRRTDPLLQWPAA